jgi:uncharacterized metal-binding protein
VHRITLQFDTAHLVGPQLIRGVLLFVSSRCRVAAWLPTVHFIDARHRSQHHQELIMNTIRQATIARATAFAMAALITLSILGGVESLAQRDVSADALLAQTTISAKG